MRTWAALLFATLLASTAMMVTPATPAGAQATGEPKDFPPTRIAEDKKADVLVCMATACQPAPDGRFSPTDLVSLDVKELPESFTFTLTVQSLSPQPAELPGAESGQYTIFFQNLDRQFRLLVQRFNFAAAQYAGQLQAYDPGRRGYFTITSDPADIEITEDVAANAIAVRITRRDLLADGHGASPHPEVPITGFRVASRALGFGFNLGRGPQSQKVPVPVATDAMPDSGNATTVHPVHFGVVQTGHARLKTDLASRASNGEATTFVFQLRALNLGAAEDRFDLAAVGAPSAWQVKLPATQVTIPGNGTLQFPVLVTTPFAHAHGSYQSFLVEMRSVGAPSAVGRVQLGIRYVNPPQPAGHHNVVWLHSTAAESDYVSTAIQTVFPGDTDLGSLAYFNALEQDPNDKRQPVYGAMDCDFVPTLFGPDCPTSPAPTAQYEWEVPLAPSLDMGLDFDTSGNGMLNEAPSILVNVKNTLPMNRAVFGGRLVYATPDGPQSFFGDFSGNATVVARLAETQPKDVGANTASTEFKTTLHATPDGEFLPFKSGAVLVLHLWLNFTRVDLPFGPKDAPQLLPGGIMTLPLVEYHDPVGDIFISTVELVATSKADRFINPGKTAVFNVTLVNHGNAADTFFVEMTGTHSPTHPQPWARLIAPGTEVTLEPGGSVKMAVIVAAPPEATRPDAADLVLTATSTTNFNQRSLLHLYAIVDPDHPYPDEADLAARLSGELGAPTAKTPGLEPLALLAVLGACVLALRRRRK